MCSKTSRCQFRSRALQSALRKLTSTPRNESKRAAICSTDLITTSTDSKRPRGIGTTTIFAAILKISPRIEAMESGHIEEFPPLFIPHDPCQSGCLFIATVEEQLFDKFLFQLQSVFRGLVFLLHSAFSLSHPDVSVVCTGTVLLHILSGRFFVQTRR